MASASSPATSIDRKADRGPPAGAARAVGLERGLQIDAACMQRRHEAEQEAGGERHARG